MFALFIQQLRGVAEPDGIYYNYHYFLLESLSTVKSIVLVFDLPEASVLQQQIIQLALDLVHPSLQKNVRLYLLELVQTLLDEGDQVPYELVLDLFIPRLVSETDTTAGSNLARTLVEDLLRQCPEKLQTPLAVYFNDQLGRLARGDESEAVLARVGREAHEFAVHVGKVSLAAAASILGLLEEELRVEAGEVRLLAVVALGQLFTHHHGNLRVSTLATLWTAWLGRRNDKGPRCRVGWIRGATGVLAAALRASNQVVAEQLLPLVIERLQDPEERVRLATLQALSADLLPLARMIPAATGLVEALAGRCLDRKEEVQTEALAVSADWLFVLLQSQHDGGSDADKNKRTRTTIELPHESLPVLLTHLLHLLFSESRIHSLVFLGFLERDVMMRMAREFPVLAVRAERLAVLMRSCYMAKDEQARMALRALLRHKAQFLKAWTGLLKLARLPEAAVTDMLRSKTIQLAQFLAGMMPGVPEMETQRALLALSTLRTSDPVLLQWLIDLAEDRADGVGLVSRIEAHLSKADSISPGLRRVLRAALPLGSLISVNAGLVGELTRLRSDASAAALPLASLLQDLLADFPQLFSDRTGELVQSVLDTHGATESLVALAQYASASPSVSYGDPAALVRLEMLLVRRVHPVGSDDAEGDFVPRATAAAALILVQLRQRDLSGLIQVSGVVGVCEEMMQCVWRTGDLFFCRTLSFSWHSRKVDRFEPHWLD